ncbi:toxin-antitoxin system YwqK family antitoxin [Aquimarina litoralis]|uniref:toxin-antitoxin system YwqK family antitoxin n=1 Tax=Aquimarina litoralis TaxID=584605 RepID=UPI001C56CE3E|nr:hypothetical protein [Aquimarina litoralis]MBW1297694.1 hypothetical protein [Aquimarina litoralis]
MRTSHLKYILAVSIIFISKIQSQELVLSSTNNVSNVSEDAEKSSNNMKTLYYSDGSKKEIRKTIDNKLDGIWKLFFRNGQLKKEGGFVQGKAIGTWKVYNKEGQLTFIENYKNGYEHGTWKAFFTDGTLKIEGDFIQGKRQGQWKIYNEKGSLTKIVNFKDDMEINEIIINDQAKDLNFFSLTNSIGNY